MFEKLFNVIKTFLKSCLIVIIGFLVLAAIVMILLTVCNVLGLKVGFLQAIGKWFYTILYSIIRWMYTQISLY